MYTQRVRQKERRGRERERGKRELELQRFGAQVRVASSGPENFSSGALSSFPRLGSHRPRDEWVMDGDQYRHECSRACEFSGRFWSCGGGAIRCCRARGRNGGAFGCCRARGRYGAHPGKWRTDRGGIAGCRGRRQRHGRRECARTHGCSGCLWNCRGDAFRCCRARRSGADATRPDGNARGSESNEHGSHGRARRSTCRRSQPCSTWCSPGRCCRARWAARGSSR